MDLWIRSQDKERLFKVKQLEIRENEAGYIITSINFENTYGYNFLTLGIYKSKERALEILDEIQGFIQNDENEAEYIHSNTELVFRTTEKLNRNVYQMPEE